LNEFPFAAGCGRGSSAEAGQFIFKSAPPLALRGIETIIKP